MSVPREQLQAVTTYWINGKPVVVRQWTSVEAAKQYMKTMRREKKKVTLQEYHPV